MVERAAHEKSPPCSPPLLSECGSLLRLLHTLGGGSQFQGAMTLLRPRLTCEGLLNALDALGNEVHSNLGSGERPDTGAIDVKGGS